MSFTVCSVCIYTITVFSYLPSLRADSTSNLQANPPEAILHTSHGTVIFTSDCDWLFSFLHVDGSYRNLTLHVTAPYNSTMYDISSIRSTATTSHTLITSASGSPIIFRYARFTQYTRFDPSETNQGHVSTSNILIILSSP